MKTRNNDSLILFWRYAKRHKNAIYGLTLIYIAATALLVLAPQTLSRFIDSVYKDSSWTAWMLAVLLYLAAMLAQSGFSALLDYRLASVGQRFTDDYRRDLLSHFLSLDLESLGGISSGQILTRLNEDVQGLFKYYYIVFYKLAGSALALAGILVTLSFKTGWLSALLLAASILSILGFKAIQDRGVNKYVRQAKANASFNSLLKEILDNSPTLRGLHAESYAETRIHAAMKERYRESFPAYLMYANLWSASTVIEAMMTALGLVLALLLWDKGSVSLGTAYLIFNYCNLVSAPLQDFRNHMGDMQGAKAGILRCGEFFDLPLRVKTGVQTLKNKALELTVQDLRFSYQNDIRQSNINQNDINQSGINQNDIDQNRIDQGRAMVLKGVNLAVPAGRKIGIMGETGCGKSTFLSLIAALNPYREGVIRLDGTDIRDIDPVNLREHVAYCTQRVQLIHGTIRENITLFNGQFTDHDILEAIGSLGLSGWFNKFPEGLDSRLERGEGSLSSGEAQLLVLVRLALRKPGLVLLDEISSSLDALTERRITEAVKRLCEDRTVLAIAHRKEALDWMDTVIRMESGVLAGPAARGQYDPQ